MVIYVHKSLIDKVIEILTKYIITVYKNEKGKVITISIKKIEKTLNIEISPFIKKLIIEIFKIIKEDLEKGITSEIKEYIGEVISKRSRGIEITLPKTHWLIQLIITNNVAMLKNYLIEKFNKSNIIKVREF